VTRLRSALAAGARRLAELLEPPAPPVAPTAPIAPERPVLSAVEEALAARLGLVGAAPVEVYRVLTARLDELDALRIQIQIEVGRRDQAELRLRQIDAEVEADRVVVAAALAAAGHRIGART